MEGFFSCRYFHQNLLDGMYIANMTDFFGSKKKVRSKKWHLLGKKKKEKAPPKSNLVGC